MALCSLFLVALGAAIIAWTFHLALVSGDLEFYMVIYGGSLAVQGMACLFGFSGNSRSVTSMFWDSSLPAERVVHTPALRAAQVPSRSGACTVRTPVLADGARGYGVSLRENDIMLLIFLDIALFRW
jgi:hypothetical protein